MTTTILPPSVPTLPTLEELAAEQIAKPAHLDDSLTGVPAVSFLGARALANPSDGLFFNMPIASATAVAGVTTALTARQENDNAWLITTQSIDDLCIVISGGTSHDGKAMVITAIFPNDALEQASRSGSSGKFLDVTSIDERLEFTHVFDVNSLGVATVASARVSHEPKADRGQLAPKFTDLETLSDALAHFYGQQIVQINADELGADGDATIKAKIVVGASCVIAIGTSIVLAAVGSSFVMIPIGAFGATLATYNFIRQPTTAESEPLMSSSSSSSSD